MSQKTTKVWALEHERASRVDGKETIMEPSEKAKEFKPGTYKHFKGGMYNAILVARHSEEHDKEFVVYQSIEKGTFWVRPLEMFLEEVDRDGYKGPRFVRISD